MTKGLCHKCYGSNLELEPKPTQLPRCIKCVNPTTEKTYHKTTPITAKQMTTNFTVNTLEGIMKGNAGDYLATGIEGEQWPIKKEIFEKTYKIL